MADILSFMFRMFSETLTVLSSTFYIYYIYLFIIALVVCLFVVLRGR